MSSSSPSNPAWKPKAPASGESISAGESSVLERDVPLSQSLLWRRQQEQYAQRGLESWTADMVPNYLTNNPFIAEVYAKVALGYLRDCIRLAAADSMPLSPERPLRILELGAGPGKFSFLFLKHLRDLMQAEGLALRMVRYCMTDGAKGLLGAWRANSALAKFTAEGVLSFEHLLLGAEIRSPFLTGEGDAAPGALLVIANYVLDSLPQDAFIVREGRLSEALITTSAPGAQPAGRGKAAALSGLDISFREAIVDSMRYSDQHWNDILDVYRASLPGATLTFPTAALKVLDALGELSDGRMLVLAADKGYAHPGECVLYSGPPTLEFHSENCFSQMVNFDAIARHFTHHGGEALLPGKHSSSLSVCAFLQQRRGDDFHALRETYSVTRNAFGPDDLFELLTWLNAHMEELSVGQMLALLRLTRWDPIALLRVFPMLAQKLNTVTTEGHDLHDAVLRTWANHYAIGPSENVLAFYCGAILLELKSFQHAAQMFKTSQGLLGPSAATSYNLGLCEQGLGRSAEAATYFAEACRLDPQFEPARGMLQKLQPLDGGRS